MSNALVNVPAGSYWLVPVIMIITTISVIAITGAVTPLLVHYRKWLRKLYKDE